MFRPGSISPWVETAGVVDIGDWLVACPYLDCGKAIPANRDFSYSSKCPACGAEYDPYTKLLPVGFVVEVDGYNKLCRFKVGMPPDIIQWLEKQGYTRFSQSEVKPLSRAALEDFRHKNICIADVLVSELISLKSVTADAVSQLIVWLMEKWSGSLDCRVGTLYLSREKDNTVSLKVPLRFGVTDEEFHELSLTLDRTRKDMGKLVAELGQIIADAANPDKVDNE